MAADNGNVLFMLTYGDIIVSGRVVGVDMNEAYQCVYKK